MFIKARINNDLELKANFTAQSIYNCCPACRREFVVNTAKVVETLCMDSSFGGRNAYSNHTVFECPFCNNKWYERNNPDGSVTYAPAPPIPIMPSAQQSQGFRLPF